MIIKVRSSKSKQPRNRLSTCLVGGSFKSPSKYADPRYEKVKALRIEDVSLNGNNAASRRYYIAGCIDNTWCSLKEHIQENRLPSSYVAEELYKTLKEAEDAIRQLAQRYDAKINAPGFQIALLGAKHPSTQYGVSKAKTTADIFTDYQFRKVEHAENTNAQVVDEIDNTDDEIITYDGTNTKVFVGTEPFYCELKGKDFAQKTWAKTFQALVEHEIEINNPALEKLKFASLNGNAERPFFLQREMDRCRCVLLSNGYWLNINHSVSQIVSYIKRFCIYCGYEPNDLSISGVKKEKMTSCHKATDAETIQKVQVVSVRKSATDILAQYECEKKVDERVIQEYCQIIAEEFPNGCIWTNVTITHIESKSSHVFSQVYQKAVMKLMFRRKDGSYILPECIAEEAIINAISEKCKLLLSEAGCFSLAVIWAEFNSDLKNITESDFRAFFGWRVISHLNVSSCVVGSKDCLVCVKGGMSEQETFRMIASKVQEYMQSVGDAVTVEMISSENPHLCENTILFALKKYGERVIEFQQNEILYFKLLDHFYLPDDFADIVNRVIDLTEKEGRSASLSVINQKLESVYGGSFRDDYALFDDEILKDVISAALQKEDYVWRHDLYTSSNLKKANLADEFIATQNGVFHEDEFFSYAEKHRGFTSHGMLILSHLRIKCIRLSKTQWIDLKTFLKNSNFSEQIKQMLQDLLLSRLGVKRFMPLGKFSDGFYSELPTIKIDEQNYYWNEYMLASVAFHLLSDLIVVNFEPSPYTVTAMVIPNNVEYNGDAVEYVMNCMKSEGYRFVNEVKVFEFLKENLIRMTLSEKLKEKISNFWNET